MPERRFWSVRFDQTKDSWCVIDTELQRYVVENKARNWCTDLRHALNKCGNPTPRAKEISENWYARLDRERE